MKKQEKESNMKETLMRLMRFLGHRKGMVYAAIGLSVISTGSTVYSSYLLKPIINDYILPANFPGLAKMLVWLSIVYFAGFLAMVIQNQLMIRVAQGTIKDIREELFDHLQTLPLSYFDRRSHGDVMSLFTNDVDTLQTMLEQGLVQIVNNSLMFVGTVALMLMLSPSLFMVTAVMMTIMLLLTTYISKRSRKYFQMQQRDIAEVNGYIEEMIEGQTVVQTFNHEKEVNKEFEKISSRYRETSTFAQTFGSLIMPVMNNVNNINYAITATVGGLSALARGFDIGTLIAYLRYTQNFAQPIQQISMQMNSVLNALAGAERIFTAMDETPEVDEGTVILVPVRENEHGELVEYGGHWDERKRETRWAWKSEKLDGSVELTPLKGDVRFETVDFSYNPGHLILKELDLYAEPGQKIAFVGSTGAGKTTITNLINRFYEIDSGHIYYDGIDISTIKKDDLRHSLGMVLQDTELFTATVMENIRYGRLHATDEEVIAAAKMAKADTFIRHLSKGYDTLLTGGGENLSEGQRQLLAIARTALANTPVLILDEATSSIDTRTEKLVGAGLDSIMKGHTVFVIAHRLSTVRDANAIMVLEHGEIIERGNHHKLMENHGRYYELNTGIAELE